MMLREMPGGLLQDCSGGPPMSAKRNHGSRLVVHAQGPVGTKGSFDNGTEHLVQNNLWSS